MSRLFYSLVRVNDTLYDRLIRIDPKTFSNDSLTKLLYHLHQRTITMVEIKPLKVLSLPCLLPIKAHATKCLICKKIQKLKMRVIIKKKIYWGFTENKPFALRNDMDLVKIFSKRLFMILQHYSIRFSLVNKNTVFLCTGLVSKNCETAE